MMMNEKDKNNNLQYHIDRLMNRGWGGQANIDNYSAIFLQSFDQGERAGRRIVAPSGQALDFNFECKSEHKWC